MFFWPKTIQYPMKFGVTKCADLDLHRSFFQKLIWVPRCWDMSILYVTTDLGYPVNCWVALHETKKREHKIAFMGDKKAESVLVFASWQAVFFLLIFLLFLSLLVCLTVCSPVCLSVYLSVFLSCFSVYFSFLSLACNWVTCGRLSKPRYFHLAFPAQFLVLWRLTSVSSLFCPHLPLLMLLKKITYMESLTLRL